MKLTSILLARLAHCFPIKWTCFTYLLLVGPLCFMLQAQDQKEPPAPTLKEAKAEYDKQDKALNAAWEAVKKGLSEAEFAALKEEQKSWLVYRDEMALSPGYSGADEDEAKAKRSPEYFSTAAALTAERAAWLKAHVSKEQPENVTGKWNDSYGGWLEVVEKEGKLYFSIEVVRGPTAHNGSISGVAVWNEPIGWFSDKGLDKDKTDETNLSFVLRQGLNGQIQVTGANTSFYHGARAYFDGNYVRVAKLDAKAQTKVVEEAKGGPTEKK